MHILILVSGYPTCYSSNQGIFFRDQAELLAANPQNQVALIATVPISFNWILKKRKFQFGLNKKNENGVATYVHTFLNLPKIHKFRVLKSRRLAGDIFAKYVSEYGKPDIIHVHGFQSGLQAVEIKKKWGIPFVITEHSTQFIDNIVSNSLKKYAVEVFHHASVAIAVSEPFARIMSQTYNKEFQYIPNVVDTSVFTLSQEESSREEFVFFNAAGFVVEKNHDLLIDAFARLTTKYPKTRLRLAGSGPNEPIIKQKVQDLGIADKVDFLGQLPRNEVIHEMQSMDVFVLSSNVETFGVVLIEALSCGKPVVSTKSYGPESIITSPNYGLLCEKTVDDLSHSMELVMIEKNRFNSNEIRDYVLQTFSGEVIRKQLMEVYHKVCTDSNT